MDQETGHGQPTAPLPPGKVALMRALWASIGLLSVAIGLAGIVLPLVPTTPMMILAAACFAKSSPRLHDWLWHHPVFGPAIQDWRRHGSIPKKAKLFSVLAMALAFGLSLWLGVAPKVLGIQAVVLSVMALWILTRPSGTTDQS
jgi:uncharacterized membrane protein YbaN (DUF454 family)